MWLVKLNDEFLKTEHPEKISGHLLKKMKILKDIVDMKDPRLLESIETCLSKGETVKLDIASHELKISKVEKGINVDIYLKIPSAKSKMRIQEVLIELELINIDNLKEL